MQKSFQLFLFVSLFSLISCQATYEIPGTGASNPSYETIFLPPVATIPPVEYPPVDEFRDPALWPFSSDSPWNTPIGNGAIYQQATDPCTQSLTFESSGAGINSEEWSHPVYQASINDPLTPLYLNGVERIRINIPAMAKSALPYNTDSHLHIIDPTGNYVVEMYRALPRASGGWDVDYYVKLDLRSSGILAGGARAYGGSAIAGLIRKGELGTGIRHALAIAQPWTHLWPGGPVWPANKDDGDIKNKYTGNYPMGQLAAIPPNINLEELTPPLSPEGLALGRAMQDFGVYNVDAAGASVVYAEPAAADELGHARNDIPRLWALLRCVTNNSPTSVGGGGTIRRAPPAPDFIAK
ncbi:MAG: hypothetical protein A2X86_10630 [Bdellovibrionales bacterium GWA2_49_15]|nr:MAG: hypothetical protein A2X86_10630 [Bdellovibrionales bacterium GWA2_49_15]HAZ11430.1 hypothetical protein [Bdellovibrionales bacterium]